MPAGALPANGLDTTLTQTCIADTPIFSFLIKFGVVQIPYNEPSWMRLIGAISINPDGSNFVRGSVWEGKVSTPVAYGVGGTWHYTQTLTPSRTRTIRAVKNGIMQDITQKRAASGILCLDTAFNYGPELPSDNSRQLEGDSPGETWGENATTSYIHVWDHFNTHILYKPPGEGSCYVPLIANGWHWAGTARPDSSQMWSLSETSANGGLIGDFPDFPTWNVNVNDKLNWE